ncbi:Dilute domain-containing protein [Entamoeba marina]
MLGHNQKVDVKFRITHIETKSDAKKLDQLVVVWERGSNKGSTTPKHVGEVINETFKFTSTFQKNDYINILNKTQCLDQIANVNGIPILIKCYFLFGNGSIEVPSEPIQISQKKVNTQRRMTSADQTINPLTQKSARLADSTLSQSTVGIYATPIRHSKATKINMSSRNVKEVGNGNGSIGEEKVNNLKSEVTYSHKISRSTDRSFERRGRYTLGTRDPAAQRLVGKNENSLSSLSQIGKQPSFRDNLCDSGKSEYSLRDSRKFASGLIETYETKSISRTSTPEKPALDVADEILLKDISSYTSFMEMEEKQPNEVNNVLTQIIITSLPFQKFLDSSVLPNAVINVLNEIVDAELVPLKQNFYLYAALSRLVLIYYLENKKQRIDSLVFFYDELLHLMTRCHYRLLQTIQNRLKSSTKQCFQSSGSDRPLFLELSGLVKIMNEFRILPQFKSIVLDDTLRLVNIVLYEELLCDKCTLNVGIQIQMLIAMISEFEFKNKNILSHRDNLVVVKEIGRVLLLSQKSILTEDARSECCPHLTIEMLVKILTNYDKLNPKEIPAGTISLLNRSMCQQRTEFFDYSAPELKDQRLKDVIKNVGETSLSPFDLSLTPLSSREYLRA